ncbi:MAG TPA: DUF4258 domain-containing protein [Caulobacter sp.]|nr:DUF4258 domain-containing protein [Caulobacter sp.]
MKPIRWMKHARDNLRDRGLSPAWAEAAIRAPDWTAPDPNDPAVERRFKVIAEMDGRVIRVPCVETADEIRALTVLLDRGARRALRRKARS